MPGTGGKLSRFRMRNIYAIDSTTIKLAYWCIDWAKHRQRKAAVKVHMVANVANRLPHFCVFGKEKVCTCGRVDTCGIVRVVAAFADALDPAVVNGLLPKDGNPGFAWVSTWKDKSFAGTIRLPDADIRAI